MTDQAEKTGIIVRGVGGQYWIDDRSGTEARAATARGIFRKEGSRRYRAIV